MCVSMIVAILPIVIILTAGMNFYFDMGTSAFEVRRLGLGANPTAVT